MIFKYFILLQQIVFQKITINSAQSAYCKNPYVRNVENIIEKDGVRVILGYNESLNSIMISYRGTSNVVNWINDFKFSIIYPYQTMPNVGIEKGFYESHITVKNKVLDSIFNLSNKYDTTNIIATGHSLGAISQLLVFDIHFEYPQYNIVQLVTFGSPRIGNKNFSSTFLNTNIPHQRITHWRDIVPHVPQEILGYYHTPSEKWYNKDNSILTICNDHNGTEDPKCSNSCYPLYCTSINDHLYYLNITMGSNGYCPNITYL